MRVAGDAVCEREVRLVVREERRERRKGRKGRVEVEPGVVRVAEGAERGRLRVDVAASESGGSA